jgi:heme transport system permease protein
VGVGPVGISPVQAAGILARHAGLDLGVEVTPQQDAVLWAIRLPRAVLAALVGAGLAVSGAALQGIFRNPLADPGLIGVSSGGALAATAAIVVGIAPLGLYALPVAAFVGGLSATMAVYALARHGGRTEVVTLLLTGLALTAIANALVGLMAVAADEQQLRDIVFWSLGSLGGATWDTVLAALPFIAVGVFVIPLYARSLNLMALGEREARHLGVDTERVRLVLVVLCALSVGAGVALAGIIVFVGLIVPHLVRLVSGPDHRIVLPASALAGAVLLLLADVGARMVAEPVEVPIGVVTGLLGGPFFLWLVHRTRRAQGGWG